MAEGVGLNWAYCSAPIGFSGLHFHSGLILFLNLYLVPLCWDVSYWEVRSKSGLTLLIYDHVYNLYLLHLCFISSS